MSMAGEQVAEVTVRPLGEVGLELGMTRYELYEVSNQALTTFHTNIDSLIQILFAFLMAMFFIAHRLSRRQFGFALVTYSVLQFLYLRGAYNAVGEFERLNAAMGLPTPDFEIWAIKFSEFTFVYTVMVAMYMGSIWWSFGCRENQKKEIGSPL
jgi:hypothetical protein